jgi:hypothetical protein
MQMLAEEILSPLGVKQDRRIAGLTPISNYATRKLSGIESAGYQNGSGAKRRHVIAPTVRSG